MLRRASLAVLATLVVASGCQALPVARSMFHLADSPIRTGRAPAPGDMCLAGLYPPFRVFGDAWARPTVWGVRTDTGERVGVIWPHGTRAAFLPALVLWDDAGRVIAREGDVIADAGGGGGPPGTIQICSFGRDY